MSKTLKYTIGIFAAILVVYLSLDIQNLEKHMAASAPASFNIADYTAIFWNDSLPASIASAPQLSDLLKLLNENPESAFSKFGHKLGISKTYYFMAKGKGTIEKVDSEFLVLALDGNTKVKIATDFIFGNSVRDGSGKVNINEFLNMTDFNAVSVAINKLVKEKVVSRLRKSAEVGQYLEFAGAIEVGSENIDLSAIRIIPVSVKISDGKPE
jgi:predicted lipoprotein